MFKRLLIALGLKKADKPRGLHQPSHTTTATPQGVASTGQLERR